jgi:hypothetical protein
MTYTLPTFIAGSTEIGGVSIDYQRIIIVLSGVLIFVLLFLFTRYNRIGLALRGIAQDERAAMMLGIDSDMTAIISLAIGSGLAGLAAILLLPLGNIVVEQGYNVLIFAVAVCIIGGLGSGGDYRCLIHHWFCADSDRKYFLLISSWLLLSLRLSLPCDQAVGYSESRSNWKRGYSDERKREYAAEMKRKERIDRGLKVRTEGIYAYPH